MLYKNPERALREARRVLKKNGRIVIGIIDKKSFLGKFYQRKKSVFYKKAIFFSAKEITKMLEGLGFSKFQYWQTMFELPEKLKQVDKIERGFGKGGFVVITAVK